MPLNQKELSKPLWNRFYNSTVLRAKGIADESLRNLHLTLLNEGCQHGAGAFVNAVPSNPFTRFSSPEFKDVLRSFLGLSPAGCRTGHIHTHACGKDRDKPMELHNCPAPSGVAALADSSVHLSHCPLHGRTHQASNACEATILAMVEACQFGHSWRRQITLVSEGDGNGGPMTWKSDLVGYDDEGKLILIDVGVKTLGALSYRGLRKTMRSRTQRALDDLEIEKTKSTTRAAARAKDLGAKLIALAFSSNGAFSRKSQDFFKRVFHHAKLRGLSHMGISFPKADTSWTSKFFSTYWRQRLVCCMCGTSAHLVLKTLAGDALYKAQLKTGARGARDFVHSYGRDGFVTPIAVRSDSDLGGVDAPEDAAFANKFGAEGTSRDDHVVPDGGICMDHFDRRQGCGVDPDPGGGGDGDTGWGAWSASDCEEAQLAQHVENCSTDAQLPFINNNAIELSKSTTPSVADSAVVMQDNDNNDDVLWCVKCGDTCECVWR